MLLWFWHTAQVTQMGFHVTVCLRVTLMGSLTTCCRLCRSDLRARVSWKQQRWAETGTTFSLTPVTFNASPSLESSPESSFTWSKRWFLHPSVCCLMLQGVMGSQGDTNKCKCGSMIIQFLMVVNSVLAAHEGTVWICYGRKFKELLWKPDYNPSAFFCSFHLQILRICLTTMTFSEDSLFIIGMKIVLLCYLYWNKGLFLQRKWAPGWTRCLQILKIPHIPAVEKIMSKVLPLSCLNLLPSRIAGLRALWNTCWQMLITYEIQH